MTRSLVRLVAPMLALSTMALTPALSPVALGAAEPVDWLVSASYVVTMDEERRILNDGAVAIQGERIVAVGSRAELAKRFLPRQQWHRPGAVLMPGLINTHTHAAMSLFRGVADDLRLQEWLERYIFPAEAKNVSPEFVRIGTQLAVLEMLLSGTTTYTDMYYFEEEVAKATKAAGMRAVLGQTIIKFPVADAKTPAEGLARTERFFKQFAGDRLITPAVAPHAVYTNTDEVLVASRKLANQYGLPMLIHLSETKRENDDEAKARGASPTQTLERLGALTGRTVAAHGVWLSDEDLAILQRRNTGLAHCPSSNMKLASGIAAVAKWLKLDLAFGLGPDGPAGSNNDFNLFEEMDLAGKLAKVATMDPETLPAQAIVEAATRRGARALGLEKEIGSLEVGKRADLITVSLSEANAFPMFHLYSHLVYALKGSDVRDVMVNGRLLVKGRVPLTLSQGEIRRSAMAHIERVKRSVATP